LVRYQLKKFLGKLSSLTVRKHFNSAGFDFVSPGHDDTNVLLLDPHPILGMPRPPAYEESAFILPDFPVHGHPSVRSTDVPLALVTFSVGHSANAHLQVLARLCALEIQRLKSGIDVSKTIELKVMALLLRQDVSPAILIQCNGVKQEFICYFKTERFPIYSFVVLIPCLHTPKHHGLNRLREIHDKAAAAP
jgi:hypothetical protein